MRQKADSVRNQEDLAKVRQTNWRFRQPMNILIVPFRY